MPSRHALLSASGSAKWLNCTPSARLEETIPEKASAYAAEGTLAHSKAEEKLTNYLEGHPRKKVQCPDGEMDEATTNYRNYVIEVLNAEKKKDPCAQLFVEVEVDLSKWIPEGFGTSDAVVVSTDTLHIVDFKYGTGVPVNAYHNSQLLLYAAGTMNIYEPLYGFSNVTVHIYQPRIDHFDSYTTTVEKLEKWLNGTVLPMAKMAYAGEGTKVSGDWCKFCRAKATCKQRAHEMYGLAEEKMEHLLSTEEIADLLPKLGPIAKWAKDLQDYALETALSGTKYEGYKVVEGASRRKITDDLEAMKRLQTAGYPYTDITETRLKTITELQKLVGKNELPKVLGDTLVKPPGAPTLVPESDKRPDITEASALEAFGEEFK